MSENNKYSHSKIYKIISPSHPDTVYIGSTTRNLSARMAEHRLRYRQGKVNFGSAELLKHEDAKIILIQSFPCKNKEQLNQKENEYIENTDCVNKRLASRSKKQWYEDNKIKISAKTKIKFICECGSEVRTADKAKHFKTKKHLKFFD